MAKRVLITGASRGIGKAIAERFKRDGFEVLTPSREEMDLSSTKSVESWLQKNAALTVDVLINNAGENRPQPMTELPLAEWERILTVNLTSVFQLTRALGAGMAKRGWGRIVNMSSVYSELARPGRSAYSASKAGLNALARTAALEFGRQGVLVNAVCPGFVDTDLTRQNNPPEKIRELAEGTALGRLAKVEEIAELVAFLGSDKNTYLTGQTVHVDGGFSIQ